MRLLVKSSEREFHISSSLISKESNDNEIDKDGVMITSEKIARASTDHAEPGRRGEYGFSRQAARRLRGSNWKIYCLSASYRQR